MKTHNSRTETNNNFSDDQRLGFPCFICDRDLLSNVGVFCSTSLEHYDRRAYTVASSYLNMTVCTDCISFNIGRKELGDILHRRLSQAELPEGSGYTGVVHHHYHCSHCGGKIPLGEIQCSIKVTEELWTGTECQTPLQAEIAAVLCRPCLSTIDFDQLVQSSVDEFVELHRPGMQYH